MRIGILSSCLGVAALAACTLLMLCPQQAPADIFIFKDGFVIEGRAVREGGTISEPGGNTWIASGFNFVDDYGRRVFFSSNQLIDPVPKKFKIDDPILYYARIYGAREFSPIRRVFDVGAWSTKGERELKIAGGSGNGTRELKLTQQITMLSPTILQAQIKPASQTEWFAVYQTREFDPEIIRSMLLTNKKFIITPTMEKSEVAECRWKLFRFFAHSEWLDMAEKELNKIAKDLPAQKDEVAKNRLLLNELNVDRQLELIKRAHLAGQHERAQALIKVVPENDIKDPKQLTAFRELLGRYRDAHAKLQTIHRLLPLLIDRVDDPAEKAFFKNVIPVIDSEVGWEEVLPPLRDSDRPLVGRLENFLTLATPLAAKLKGSGKLATTDPSAAELLSFAVSGWLLGNASSEKQFKTAQRLWEARELIVKHQNTADGKERKRLLEDYKTAVTPEEFAYLISLLPPVEPGDGTPGKTMKLKTESKRIPYQLRLPAEYRHQRPCGYPVLFVLHDGAEDPEDALERWAKLADQFGFILVAPRWSNPRSNNSSYRYTPREHDAVLDVLHDLRRQFCVDSDRVFLHGLGEGGTMAYDVGLSHPDLFAGILPMSASPAFYCLRYANNAQTLPIYAVLGDHSDNVKWNRQIFEPLGSHGFPIFMVLYQGRGSEWFPGEVPNAFDWMSRKVRASPIAETGKNAFSDTGRSLPFASLRSTDDRFYWVSINEFHVEPPSEYRGGTKPATVRARISEKNQINIDKIDNIKRLTVWFGRSGMIDFEQPVKIYAANTQYKETIKPDLATLLEDFYARGDRQRLFLAKFEMNVK